MTLITNVLQEQFLGKKVEIKIAERDNFGKETNHLIPIQGVVQWIGENELWPDMIQVTINRTPFTIKHISHIKLI